MVESWLQARSDEPAKPKLRALLPDECSIATNAWLPRGGTMSSGETDRLVQFFGDKGGRASRKIAKIVSGVVAAVSRCAARNDAAESPEEHLDDLVPISPSSGCRCNQLA